MPCPQRPETVPRVGHPAHGLADLQCSVSIQATVRGRCPGGAPLQGIGLGNFCIEVGEDRLDHRRILNFEVSVIPHRNASPGNSLVDRAQAGANSETAPYLRRWFQKKGEGGAGIRGLVLRAIRVPVDTMTID